MCGDVVCRDPYHLQFIHDKLKTQGICEKVVEDNFWHLIDVLEHLETKEMCEKAVNIEPLLLRCVPDCFKTKEMHENVVGTGLGLLKDVPDWIMTQQQIKTWSADNNYCSDHELIKWYTGYQKRNAQKAKVKELFYCLAPIKMVRSVRSWRREKIDRKIVEVTVFLKII